MYKRTREFVMATRYILDDSFVDIGVMATIFVLLRSNKGEFADRIEICDMTL